MTPTQRKRDRAFIFRTVRTQRAKLVGAMLRDGIAAQTARGMAYKHVTDWWMKYNDEQPDDVVPLATIRLALAGANPCMT